MNFMFFVNTAFYELKFYDSCSHRIYLSTYLSVHFFLGELADVLDSFGSSLLKLDSLESFVQIKCIVAARWLHLSGFSHLN